MGTVAPSGVEWAHESNPIQKKKNSRVLFGLNFNGTQVSLAATYCQVEFKDTVYILKVNV